MSLIAVSKWIQLGQDINGTKEWDTAASHIILKEAGCKIIDIKTKKELTYNKETFKNNHFIACRNDLSFEL